MKKIEKEYNLTHQSSAFLTQQQSNVDNNKKIEELENKLKIYVGKMNINLLDEIENEMNKCKESEDKNEELEYQKLQILAAKRSVDEENIKLSSENLKFVDLVKELNEKLEKYKGLEKSLFDAVAKKDDGDKQINVETRKKQKIVNNDTNNEENPYRKKKKDNIESINLDEKIEIIKDKNDVQSGKSLKKEKLVIEEKDIKKSHLENVNQLKDKSKENAINIEKSMGIEQSKEKKEEIHQNTKENEKGKKNKIMETESRKIIENEKVIEISIDDRKKEKEVLKVEKNVLKDEPVKEKKKEKIDITNTDFVSSKILENPPKDDRVKELDKMIDKNDFHNEKSNENVKEKVKNEIKKDSQKLLTNKDNASIQLNHDLKKELQIENKMEVDVIINSENIIKEPILDSNVIHGIKNHNNNVQSDKQVETDQNCLKKTILESDPLKHKDENINKNMDSEKKTKIQENNIIEQSNKDLMIVIAEKEKTNIEKVENKESKNKMDHMKDNTKENNDNKDIPKGIEKKEIKADIKEKKNEKIRDEFSEFDDYFETVQKTRDIKPTHSNHNELDNLKIPSESKNHLPNAKDDEKLPTKDGNSEVLKVKEKINDKIIDKQKTEDKKATEKIIDKSKPNEVKEQIQVKEPIDNEYNFEDSFPAGDIPEKFGGGFDLKNFDKNKIDKKQINNDIEYNYDDFIVDSHDNNLFPKGK